MERPTKEQVDYALSKCAKFNGDRVVEIIAAEVWALREEYEQYQNDAKAFVFNKAREVTREVLDLRSTIARVEALPAKWRTTSVWHLHVCADELEAALKGGK